VAGAEAGTLSRVLEAGAEVGADRSPLSRQLCLSPAAAGVPAHGNSLMDGSGFVSVACR